jgi:hypothetical protein
MQRIRIPLSPSEIQKALKHLKLEVRGQLFGATIDLWGVELERTGKGFMATGVKLNQDRIDLKEALKKLQQVQFSLDDAAVLRAKEDIHKILLYMD